MPCIAITLPIGTGMGNHMEFNRVRGINIVYKILARSLRRSIYGDAEFF